MLARPQGGPTRLKGDGSIFEMGSKHWRNGLTLLPRGRIVFQFIKGKRGVTAATAIDLAEALNTTPEFWMNLQQAWDLEQAYRLREAS